MSDETKPCDYCGTTLTEDESIVVATGDRHYVSTCREYVHTALRATTTALARAEAERDALRGVVEAARAFVGHASAAGERLRTALSALDRGTGHETKEGDE